MNNAAREMKQEQTHRGSPGPDPSSLLVSDASQSGILGLDVAIRLQIKRLFDFSLSLLLLVILSPLFVLIAIAIRVDSSGPVLFTQVRIGENRRRSKRPTDVFSERRRERLGGRPFRVLKFRTMHATTDQYATSPTEADDGRITPVGRFLRKTCLDELPQLLNVVSGEMSLVGPRPEMPFIVETYDDLQRQRLDAKPGITGLWQLHGMRDRYIHESIGWDLHYVKAWSLQLDLSILAQTVVFALRAKNH